MVKEENTCIIRTPTKHRWARRVAEVMCGWAVAGARRVLGKAAFRNFFPSDGPKSRFSIDPPFVTAPCLPI